MQEKPCFKCGIIKSLSEFYRHSQMADGRLNKCKTCTKADVNQHRQENLERIQEYDRQRGQLAYRKKANRDRYKKVAATKKGKERLRAYAQAWIEKNRHKRNVHIVVGSAIQRGLIIPDPCQKCGRQEGVQAHHEDYSRPFEITWLCTECHGKRHREINEKFR